MFLQSFTYFGCLQSPDRGLKFCSAWARIACVILAHATSCHIVIFNLPLPSNTVQSCSRAKDSSPSRFLFMIVTPCCRYSKNNVYVDIFKFNVYTRGGVLEDVLGIEDTF